MYTIMQKRIEVLEYLITVYKFDWIFKIENKKTSDKDKKSQYFSIVHGKYWWYIIPIFILLFLLWSDYESRKTRGMMF